MVSPIVIVGPGSIKVPGITTSSSNIARTQPVLNPLVRRTLQDAKKLQDNNEKGQAMRVSVDYPEQQVKDVELNYNLYLDLDIIQAVIIDRKNNEVIREIPTSYAVEFRRRFNALNNIELGVIVNLTA
jgi:uncharacterized FlaG/YvyC family protein